MLTRTDLQRQAEERAAMRARYSRRLVNDAVRPGSVLIVEDREDNVVCVYATVAAAARDLGVTWSEVTYLGASEVWYRADSDTHGALCATWYEVTT